MNSRSSTRPARGLPVWRILLRNVLPNKVGPIVVFATPTAPQGLLQESFLSLPGVGVRLMNPVKFYWRLVIFPCAALSATLPALSVVGDGLREAFDVRGERQGCSGRQAVHNLY